MITGSLQGIIPVPIYLLELEGYSVIDYIEGAYFTPTDNLVREARPNNWKVKKISSSKSGEVLP